jgi:hypothetical protein
MKEVKYTLLSEGTSDKALMPILDWLLQCHLPEYAIQSAWADLARFPKPPKTLEERIQSSIEYYPCDVLFIHRDADAQGRSQRLKEIDSALNKLAAQNVVPVIGVIPIRMTEAWLLFDEAAIRSAAENPAGRQSLILPKLAAIEQQADPKETLYGLLRQASGKSGRRLKQFNARLSDKVKRISELTDNFVPLRQLGAFMALEAEIDDFAKRYDRGCDVTDSIDNLAIINSD